jgi:hypothetical protein
MALLVAACGSTPGGPAPPPPDEALGRAARAGRLALEVERPADAARLYGVALARARERDDATAIADTGIGLAAAELARGQASAALRTTREVRAELVRRDASVPAALVLAEALALYRLGDKAQADAAAALVTRQAVEDADAARRAWFLRGLIAADRGDGATLGEARAALADATTRGFRGDARELDAAAALQLGDMAQARRLAQETAMLRREGLDYRGVSRALALEAEAARRAGDNAAAADLLLRAGRGAAARREWAEARGWLNNSMTLARLAGRPEIGNEARDVLRAMAERERDA